VIVDVFAQAYADQQDAPSTTGDRRARVLFDRLLYRVARIEKLTGLSLKDQRDRTLVLLAVTWEAIADGVPPAAGEPGDPGF
jgi:sugar diacid utilization regulator